MVPIIFWAEKPMMIPATPAEAKTLRPTCLMPSKLIRAMPTASTMTMKMKIRSRMVNWVTTFRAFRLSVRSRS